MFIYFRYPHGNYLGTLNFIWKASDTKEISEYYETFKAQMITCINDIILIYCTKQMRKNMFQKISCKHYLYCIYFFLKILLKFYL